MLIAERKGNKDIAWATETLDSIMDSVFNYELTHTKEAHQKMRELYNELLNAEVEKLQAKLRKEFYGNENHFSVSDVIRIVCDFYNLHPKELDKKSKERNLVQTKQVIHWALKNNVVKNSLTMKQIGSLTGFQHHATVHHNERVVRNRIKFEKRFREEIMQICNKLGAKTIWNGNRLEIKHQ